MEWNSSQSASTNSLPNATNTFNTPVTVIDALTTKERTLTLSLTTSAAQQSCENIQVTKIGNATAQEVKIKLKGVSKRKLRHKYTIRRFGSNTTTTGIINPRESASVDEIIIKYGELSPLQIGNYILTIYVNECCCGFHIDIPLNDRPTVRPTVGTSSSYKGDTLDIYRIATITLGSLLIISLGVNIFICVRKYCCGEEPKPRKQRRGNFRETTLTTESGIVSGTASPLDSDFKEAPGSSALGSYVAMEETAVDNRQHPTLNRVVPMSPASQYRIQTRLSEEIENHNRDAAHNSVKPGQWNPASGHYEDSTRSSGDTSTRATAPNVYVNDRQGVNRNRDGRSPSSSDERPPLPARVAGGGRGRGTRRGEMIAANEEIDGSEREEEFESEYDDVHIHVENNTRQTRTVPPVAAAGTGEHTLDDLLHPIQTKKRNMFRK